MSPPEGWRAGVARFAAEVLLLSGCSSAVPQGPADATSASGPCAGHAFDDRSTASADRTVDFGGQGSSGPFSYSPRCMSVSRGQSVTFSGDFSVHPLAAGAAPGASFAGSPMNPIPSTSSGSATVKVTFPAAGNFPYFCRHHYAAGMVGEVEVN